MTEIGRAKIDLAKSDGSWTLLDSVEDLIIPDELEQKLQSHPPAFGLFNHFSPSVKKGILWWIISAKTEITRKKRIDKTVRMAKVNKRAQFDSE